jgi:hypothetical protein
VTFELDRNVDGDGLLLVYCEEVDVKAIVLYRMELELMENHRVVLLAIEGEVDDEGIRSAEESLEILFLNCEENILDSVAIEIARDEALLAECLDDGFVANLTGLAVKCEMLHFFYC